MSSRKTVQAQGFPELLTPAETAAILRVDGKTLARWEKAGKIGSLRTAGGHRRYIKAEVYGLLGYDPDEDQ